VAFTWGVNVTNETRVMPQEDSEKILANNPMCDMVDDKEMGVESSHAMNDGQESLYEGCDKYSKLYFLMKLYHIKCLRKISDKAMSMILELLVYAFEHVKIPHSFYEAKKIISMCGLNYTKSDSCPNDCMLYFGEDTDRYFCKKSKTFTCKENKKDELVSCPSYVYSENEEEENEETELQAHQQRPTARKRAWFVHVIGKPLYIKFKMKISVKSLSIIAYSAI